MILLLLYYSWLLILLIMFTVQGVVTTLWRGHYLPVIRAPNLSDHFNRHSLTQTSSIASLVSQTPRAGSQTVKSPGRLQDSKIVSCLARRMDQQIGSHSMSWEYIFSLDEMMSVSVLWVWMNSFIFLVPRMRTAIATLNQGFQTFKGAFMLMLLLWKVMKLQTPLLNEWKPIFFMHTFFLLLFLNLFK